METKDALKTEEKSKPLDPSKAREIIDSYPEKSRRYLLPILQKVQAAYRYLPEEIILMIMDDLEISKAQIYGVISFYPQLMITEPGKYIIKLCYGTACFVKGAPVIADKLHDIYHIRPGDTDKTKLFTMQTASCLGNCGAAPMIIIGNDTHGCVDPEKTGEVFGAYKLEDSAEAKEAIPA